MKTNNQSFKKEGAKLLRKLIRESDREFNVFRDSTGAAHFHLMDFVRDQIKRALKEQLKLFREIYEDK
jgi:hypothetical protein